jgi:hypothetical protein
MVAVWPSYDPGSRELRPTYMFTEPGVVLSPSTVHHVPRPKADTQTLSLGPRLQPHQLGCSTILPHMEGQPLTQYPAVAAQNSVTLPYPARPLVPNPGSYAAYELSETQLSHIRLTMDRLQRQDLQARQSRPLATQFDMSEQVSLPFAMLRALLHRQASVSAIHSIGLQHHS